MTESANVLRHALNEFSVYCRKYKLNVNMSNNEFFEFFNWFNADEFLLQWRSYRKCKGILNIWALYFYCSCKKKFTLRRYIYRKK